VRSGCVHCHAAHVPSTMNLQDQDVKARGSTEDFRNQEILLIITSSKAFTLAHVARMRMEIILQRAHRRRKYILVLELGIHKSIGWRA
jgi:hypothetical protein